MNKLVTLTTSPEELEPMLGLIRRLYHGRAVEGLSIIWGEPEWDLDANPFIQRYYSEYSRSERPPHPASPWIDLAIKRVILEEKPDVLVVPNASPHYRDAVKLAQSCGIKCLLWPDGHPRAVAELAPDAIGLLEEHELQAVPEDCKAFGLWGPLLHWLTKTTESARVRHTDGLRGGDLIDGVWDKVMARLPEGPIRCEQRDCGQGDPVASLHLFDLATAEDPGRAIEAALQELPLAFFLETINCPLRREHRSFRYREYDNEFASVPADCDLHQVLSTHGGLHWKAEILNPGTGCAQGDGPLEAPDGPRLILVKVSREPLEQEPWWKKYQLPESQKLNIVLADSMNMAGSLANHCLTINRYTQHSAIGLCTEEHPWISYPQEECRLKHLGAKPTPDIIEALEQADGFIFFEDDDETSSSWPFDLRPYVYGKPVVHVYIGYRIHKKVAAMQRPGRTVLTPLPHIMRMVPGANFYAGFPPASLYDVPMRPPQSESDGIIRVLQTPSMPHRILSRFVYHKDTEAFIAASRELKERHPRVEFLQLGGLPHRQILEARQLCDITLNHLRGYISLSGDEALYFKRSLVHAFDRFSINRHKEYWGLETPFPWLTATPETLAAVFELLIGDKALRTELGEAGHSFIQDYFAPKLGILPLIWHLAHAPEAQGAS